MANGYDVDLRERAVLFVEAGNGIGEAIKIFGASRSSITLWIKNKAERGHLNPLPHARKPKVVDETVLLKKTQELKDYTAGELQNAGVSGSVSSITRALHRNKLSFKKKSRII
jgi:transposase